MTKEQFLDIEKQLYSWMEERGITIESQRENFYVNYTEELWEFFKGVRDKNTHEIIDSLCDMFVIAVNAGFEYEDKEVDYFVRTKEVRSSHYLLTDPFFSKRVDGVVIELILLGYDPYKCLLETIRELNSRTGSWSNEKGKWVKDVGAYTLEEAHEKSGITQTLEVNDCNGYWVFVGKKHPDGVIDRVEITKWYKADYTHCKKSLE